MASGLRSLPCSLMFAVMFVNGFVDLRQIVDGSAASAAINKKMSLFWPPTQDATKLFVLKTIPSAPRKYLRNFVAIMRSVRVISAQTCIQRQTDTRTELLY